MTIPEAKVLFQSYNCSYFRMCIENFCGYMEYRRLEIALWQEEEWKEERIREMYGEILKTGKTETFQEMYEIAADFHNREKLILLCNSLHGIPMPEKIQNRIELAETILGRKNRNVRSGMIYWAFDLHNLRLTVLLLFYVQSCLEEIKSRDIYMIRRVQRAKRLYRVIEGEIWQDM